METHPESPRGSRGWDSKGPPCVFPSLHSPRAPGLVLHKEPLFVSQHLPRKVVFLFMVVKHTKFTSVTSCKCTVHSRCCVAITTIVSPHHQTSISPHCNSAHHSLPVSTNLTALRASCKELYSICPLLPDLFPECDGLRLHVKPCVRRSFLFWAE